MADSNYSFWCLSPECGCSLLVPTILFPSVQEDLCSFPTLPHITLQISIPHPHVLYVLQLPAYEMSVP